MSECRIMAEHGRHHFITKRFDRTPQGKLHMQTYGALAHISYQIPDLSGYESMGKMAARLGLGYTEIRQLYRRMVFNVLAVNQDDHVKNFSFLMNKSGTWSLAPAYDLTFSYDRKNKWLAAHQMTINGKNEDVGMDDLLCCAREMGVRKSDAKDMVIQVADVVAKWPEYAEKAGIRKETTLEIQKIQQDQYQAIFGGDGVF